MHRVLLACSAGATRLFRMNVGLAWIGQAKKYDRQQTVVVHAGDVVIRQARPFRAGIEGMSDLVGFTSITITPEMVGRRAAVYTALECKGDGGRLRDAQKTFIDCVDSAGGIAGVVRSELDARHIIDKGAELRSAF
jgi:hypothetical protein